jgi:Tol biopolymer transport system component
MRARVGSALLLAASLGLAPSAAPASFPPELRFRSLETRLVIVDYSQELEPTARRAAALATEILARHEARYGIRVGPKVHIVLADDQDSPNGFATPLPYPLVNIRAVAPDGSDDFGNYESWLRLVLTHELAHIVHLEPAAGLSGLGRKLLGRAPFLFYNSVTPTWMIEGLATYEETEGTAFGRGRNPDSRMVLRMAALEGSFLDEDQPVLGLDRWPSGLGSYLFGEAFLRDLTSRSGPDTLPRLAHDNVHHVVPYLDELTATHVTGTSFHSWWKEWAFESKVRFREQAKELAAQGLTSSRALGSHGLRQASPRFSPDGRWIAYTANSLERHTSLRLVRADGTEDHELVECDGGGGVSWTADGKGLVYEEANVYRRFSVRSDLRYLDVATRRVRRLSHGLRARQPDVSRRDGRIVFVRRLSDRGELGVMGLDGRNLRQLTHSTPGTEWNFPRWSPDGTFLVASRFTEGGWLDLVRIEPETGEVTELIHDRAKDVEPTFSPDGSLVLFRSDRDGISNLYALRLADAALLRVTRVLGGAFEPDVSPDGQHVAFSGYDSEGYKLRVAELSGAGLENAAPFEDTHPAAQPEPPPVTSKERPYRPFPTLLPRFWAPYVARESEEWTVGVATGGADPLVRHAYGLDVHVGVDSGRLGYRGFYQYNRLWPTLQLTLRDTTDLESDASLDRTRELQLIADLPVTRSLRSSQDLTVAYRRRRDSVETDPVAASLDLGAIETAWTWTSAKQYRYSISQVDGSRLQLAWARESPALGSDVSLSRLTGDLRSYLRLGGRHALALRLAGGGTLGQPGFQRSFSVGGFPDSGLFDVVRTNVSVLRGYKDDAFSGRSFVSGNAEWRFPLGYPQHGWRSFPAFLRHVHGTLFADAASAWSGDFRGDDLKTSAGAALGSDLTVSHVLPTTFVLGVARGFNEGGETRFYFRVGLSF